MEFESRQDLFFFIGDIMVYNDAIKSFVYLVEKDSNENKPFAHTHMS